MDLLEKIASPAVQQKYVDKMRLQILSSLLNKKYDFVTQPRCPVLDDVLCSAVSTSLGVSDACCSLIEELVYGGQLDAKYASQQLHSAIACALDSAGSVSTIYVSKAVSLLPRILPVESFSHPIILLLDEYPSLWPYVLSLLEVWLKSNRDFEAQRSTPMASYANSGRPIPRTQRTLSQSTVRDSSHWGEVHFIVLHTILRPDWPLEHAALRMRVNQLLLADMDQWKPLVTRYTRWLPIYTSSTHLLQMGQILSDNYSSLGGAEAIVGLLAFFREVSTTKDADFSFVIHAAIRIAHRLKADRGASHTCVTLLLSYLLSSCGRLYGLALLELARVLLDERLLAQSYHLALALCHSSVAELPAAKQMLAELRKDNYGINKAGDTDKLQGGDFSNWASAQELRSVPSDILAACVMASDSEQVSPSEPPEGIASLLQVLVVSGKLVTCQSKDLTAWIQVLKDLCRADTDNACVAFFAICLRLDRETLPRNILLLLESLPQIAVNKICAAMVRDLLFTLCRCSRESTRLACLFNVALVVMSRLYVQHDTLTFPVLLRIIHFDKDQLTLSSAIAKAQGVRTIALHSPWLHGPDIVPLLHRLLSVPSAEMCPVISLCTQAVAALVEHGILALPSFLQTFGRHLNDVRPRVKSDFHRLFALLPLANLSERKLLNYQKHLWALLFSETDAFVKAACLDALANFTDITIDALPAKEASKLHHHGDDTTLTSDGAPRVPASFFTTGALFKLCSQSKSTPLQRSYINFIATRIRHEVKHLPRSVVLHREGRQPQSARPREARRGGPSAACLSQIPRLQQSLLHQSAANVRPFAAAGLLLTYNPPVKTDQNGAATKSALIQHSDSFVSMFRLLLEAVPAFGADNWFMSLTCLPQWHLLVERTFTSLTNGRKADRDSDEDAKLSATLWARDRLASIVVEEGSVNGIIALCSLVGIVYEYDKTLKLKERLRMNVLRSNYSLQGRETLYISHSQWSGRALRSLVQLIQKKPIEDDYFANLLSNFTRSASSTEGAIGGVLFSLHHMLGLLQSQGLLEESIRCFTVKRQNDEFLAAVGGGLMVQTLATKGIIDIADNVRKICGDILRKFDVWTFDQESGHVASPSYLLGLTVLLSGLCSRRGYQACTQYFCARLMHLLRISFSSTSGDLESNPPSLGVVSPSDVTAASSSANTTSEPCQKSTSDYLDQVAVCCALLAVNGRHFVLGNRSRDTLSPTVADNNGCSDDSDADTSRNGDGQKELREFAGWLTQKRGEKSTSAGIATALGIILYNMAQHDPITGRRHHQQDDNQQQQQSHEFEFELEQGLVGARQVEPETTARNIAIQPESHRLVEALLTKVWLPVIASPHESAPHKNSAVSGIAALTGAFSHLVIQSKHHQQANVVAAGGKAWNVDDLLTRDVVTTLLDAMLRDVNTSSHTSQVSAGMTALKTHHIWTLGLFHRTLARPAQPDNEHNYPAVLCFSSSEFSILSEAVNHAAKEAQLPCLLLSGLGQRFESALPCFAWIQFQRHLEEAIERSDQQVQRSLITLAVENATSTPSLVPLLEACITPPILHGLEDSCKDFLLDRLRVVLEVCDSTRLGPLLSLYKDRRLNNDDIHVAEEAWKLLASYLEDTSAKASSVSLMQEVVCYATLSTKARHFVAACLLRMRDDATLLEHILQHSLGDAPSRRALRTALELKLALAGVLDMSIIQNPFSSIDVLADNEFAEFATECVSIACCPVALVENSAKWLLEILPRGAPLTPRAVALLSLLALMMSPSYEKHSAKVGATTMMEHKLIRLLPYQISQMLQTKIWGETAVEKLLDWLVSTLESTCPSNKVYAVLHDTLMALRRTQALRNGRNLWSRAIML